MVICQNIATFAFIILQTSLKIMSLIEIKKVETKKDLKTFIDFHYDLYEGNEYDVPNLFSDDMNTLSKDKNAAFEFCEAEYFLAYKDGKLAGRVAAIINHKANNKWDRKSVRFGWIDFIDDREVSRALLDAVEKYGKEKGMEDIVGPLGFTDMDPEHIEALEGFTVDNKYVEYKLMVPDTIPEKYSKIAAMIEKRYNLHVRKLTRKDIYQGGYGQKIFDLINDTYKHLYGYSELSQKQIDQYIKMYLSLLDLNFVTAIEDWTTEDHKMIGIGITMPSLSRALQKCHRGRLLPFGWWHLLRAIKFHKTKIVDLLLIGIQPEYRAKGANALLFADLIPIYQKYGIEWAATAILRVSGK